MINLAVENQKGKKGFKGFSTELSILLKETKN